MDTKHAILLLQHVTTGLPSEGQTTAEIAKSANIGLGTARKYLQYLSDQGYVANESRPKLRWVVTTAGIDALRELVTA
jgi:predicted transcriptional regulator